MPRDESRKKASDWRTRANSKKQQVKELAKWIHKQQPMKKETAGRMAAQIWAEESARARANANEMLAERMNKMM